MGLPHLLASDIATAIPDLDDIQDPLSGGQKLVFPCRLNGEPIALKVMLTGASPARRPGQQDEATERAMREVELMRQIDSPYLVKLGAIELTHATINSQKVIYFAEEWIEGTDLKTLIQRSGPLSPDAVIELGLNIVEAISLLWDKDVVHRDIKPGNIMRRDATGGYVLLDLGIALDLSDISLTRTGRIAMTEAYASPEQLDPSHKRDLDCRSDFFSLGIVLYEALTGKHPFQSTGIMAVPVGRMIQHMDVTQPSQIKSGIPQSLDKVICRLLEKKTTIALQKLWRLPTRP